MAYDWKTYSPAVSCSREELGTSVPAILTRIETEMESHDEQLRDQLNRTMFVDGGLGIALGDECFDATCDHCCGFWDRLFASQEEADQWLTQHHTVCVTLQRPSKGW